ncbi:hypothetical protein ACFU3J_00350 [Streptomyces sp. NPDC057411]|uniref:hypothetical protein n=1 Tax=unclassified Streptomyces TaxID=2593676 RepID=UPI00362C3D6D
MRNESDSPVELIDARVLDLPKGLKVNRYAAFDSEETRGVALIFPDGDPQFPAATYKDYSKQPIKLDPGKENYIYHSVKVTVTGPVSGEASTCRFTYTQGSDRFTQDLPCRFTLSLEK